MPIARARKREMTRSRTSPEMRCQTSTATPEPSQPIQKTTTTATIQRGGHRTGGDSGRSGDSSGTTPSVVRAREIM